MVLLDLDFDAENQDEIVRIIKKLSVIMRERNIKNPNRQARKTFDQLERKNY